MLSTERLIALRENRKLRKKEVAEILNLEQSTYGKYELGQRQPSLEILDKLADFFHVTTDYLLGKSDDPTPQPTVLEKVYAQYGIPKKDTVRVEVIDHGGATTVREIPKKDWPVVKAMIDAIIERDTE